jgi:hypothetical protein
VARTTKNSSSIYRMYVKPQHHDLGTANHHLSSSGGGRNKKNLAVHSVYWYSTARGFSHDLFLFCISVANCYHLIPVFDQKYLSIYTSIRLTDRNAYGFFIKYKEGAIAQFSDFFSVFTKNSADKVSGILFLFHE